MKSSEPAASAPSTEADTTREWISKVEADLETAKQIAAEATAKFDDIPTEKSAVAQMVAAKRLEKASKALDDARAIGAPIFAAEFSAAAQREFETLVPFLYGFGEVVEKRRKALIDRLTKFRDGLVEDIQEIGVAVTETNHARRRADGLSNAAGHPENFVRVTTDKVLEDITQGMSQIWQHQRNHISMSLSLDNNRTVHCDVLAEVPEVR